MPCTGHSFHVCLISTARIFPTSRMTRNDAAQVFLAAERNDITYRNAMIYLAMRTNRRLIQNVRTCIDDICNKKSRHRHRHKLHLDASPALFVVGRFLPGVAFSRRKRATRYACPRRHPTLSGVGQDAAPRRQPLGRAARNADGSIHTHAVKYNNRKIYEYVTTFL